MPTFERLKLYVGPQNFCWCESAPGHLSYLGRKTKEEAMDIAARLGLEFHAIADDFIWPPREAHQGQGGVAV